MDSKTFPISLWYFNFLILSFVPSLALQRCDFPVIFNFGDSNSDTGSMEAVFPMLNSPYGDAYFHRPAGRFSDGRLIVDFFGGVFAKSKSKEEYFGKGLYMFDIGQNDIGLGQYIGKSIEEVNASIPQIITHYSTIIEDTYKAGGRSFWIHNIEPVGCLPYILGEFPSSEKDEAGCAKIHNQLAQYFNLKLNESIFQLRTKYPLATFVYVGIYSVKYSLFLSPQQHGFEHPHVSCCGHGGIYNFRNAAICGQKIESHGEEIIVNSCEDPSKRVVWDGVHYTKAANKFVFNHIISGAFSQPPIPLNMACHDVAYSCEEFGDPTQPFGLIGHSVAC